MFFQVAYPTDKDDKTHWPKDTFSMDGKMGPDFMTNFMLKERLAIEKDFDEIAKAPNRRSWGGNTPLEVNAFCCLCILSLSLSHTHTHTHTHTRTHTRTRTHTLSHTHTHTHTL